MPSRCRVLVRADDFLVRAEHEYTWPDHVVEEVDRAWARRSPAAGFHDGNILVYLGREETRPTPTIIAAGTRYRFFWTRRHRPDLALKVWPLGVSGLVVSGPYLLFGRRSAAVTEYPGRWELVPSGGIDARFRSTDGQVDYRGQLAAELTEETGLGPDVLQEIHPLALIHDVAEDVYDICCRLELRLDRTAIMDRLTPGREYGEFRFLTADEVSRLPAGVEALVPTSLALMELLS